MAKKAKTVTAKKRVPKKAFKEEVLVQEPQPKVEAKAEVKVEAKALKGEEGIDIVVPMVFASSSVWLKAYKEACGKYGREPKIDERVRSWDLERYFFRGIAKFMPFVRKVHLILSGEDQIPFWMNKDKVHIVLHKDIMPSDVLPTFNSSTIEMWLHNIEGLSETFIYCNDDMIAVSPLKAENFFKDGKPVTRCAEKPVAIVGAFLKTIKNALDMAAKDFGKSYGEDITLRDGHSYAPMLLSAIRETVEKHGQEMHDSCTAFREDKNINQYLYTYEMLFAGKCVNGYHSHQYFSLSSDYDKMKKMLLDGTVGVACFNDSGIGDIAEMKGVLFNAMQQILGEKCEYEI